jgi:hypothetical protein
MAQLATQSLEVYFQTVEKFFINTFDDSDFLAYGKFTYIC